MACLGPNKADTIPSSLPQTRRPALIPPDGDLSTPQADGHICMMTQQPPLPPPDLSLFQELQCPSPPSSESSISDTPVPSIEGRSSREQSPASCLRGRGGCGGLPKAVIRDPRRRAAYLKARAQYARDRRIQQLLIGPDQEDTTGSLRKHAAFVVDEELHSEREGRADTPHLSEALPGEEDVIVQGIEEDSQEPGLSTVAATFEGPIEEAQSDSSIIIPRSAPERNVK